MRNLVLVLGDQLDEASAVWDDFDNATDAVWMAECLEETTHVWCHQLRIAMFFSAMRHFRDALRKSGRTVHYQELATRPADDVGTSFEQLLSLTLQQHQPLKIVVVEPGDQRVRQQLMAVAQHAKVPLEFRTDRHFYSTIEEFRQFAQGRKQLLQENFYRLQRRTHRVLLDDQGDPLGGAWNFDADNRETFKKTGPPRLPPVPQFPLDETSQQVCELVATRFSAHPGSLANFDRVPVTRQHALVALADFIQHRLALFGKYEDAIWQGEPVLYHSRLSTSLNLKLISPRECVDAAISAYEQGLAPLNSVEGFVRQILGWREFIRGVYWTQMPSYAERNHLEQTLPLPSFFWDGQTDMACVRDAMHSVLEHGYAHHIQRLMVLGNLAQTYGADPYRFHEWHMAMYLDAIDWVSLPNTLGMSQFGDGGIVGTKPYCATGAYVQRMSNYCQGCRYEPKQATGPEACPLTTFYWDFLARHATRLKSNHRMGMQLKNVANKTQAELTAIQQQAAALRQQWQAAGSSPS